MSTLDVPGARLWYEVSGSGPLLILIPGASGPGESFRLLVHHLHAHYQVVTYDRRGFSRSQLDGPQDYAHRLATDAELPIPLPAGSHAGAFPVDHVATTRQAADDHRSNLTRAGRGRPLQRYTHYHRSFNASLLLRFLRAHAPFSLAQSGALGSALSLFPVARTPLLAEARAGPGSRRATSPYVR